MKNLILFASLFMMLFTACSEENEIDTISNIDSKIEKRGLIPFCDLPHFNATIDECKSCCVDFQIDMPNADFDYTTFETFINGVSTTFITPSADNNNFQICYDDEDGRDEMFIIFYDANWDPICIWNQSIFYEPCEEKPVSHLCWEDFIGYFKCATSITVKLPDGKGEETVIPFADLDAAWCADNPDRPCPDCPCSSSVLVPGGFCCIANQIYAALESTGFEFEFNRTDPNEEIGCFKGPYPLPGFFIYSDVEIVSIQGDDCDGGAEGSAEFESMGHCF